MMRMNTDPQKLALFHEVNELLPGTSARAQRARVQEVIERGYSLSTFEAMRYLDVYHCPARVNELKNRGIEIETHWTVVVTEVGAKHRVGNYLKRRGGDHEA